MLKSQYTLVVLAFCNLKKIEKNIKKLGVSIEFTYNHRYNENVNIYV